MPDNEKPAPKVEDPKFSRNAMIAGADFFSTEAHRVRPADVAGALRLAGHVRTDRTGDEPAYTHDDVRNALREWRKPVVEPREAR